ncbi:MAG: tetratricopeptide repeat protein [Gammaproteobacteria bacterium]
MSQFRLARISLILAALGLNAAPVLLSSAHAEDKPAAKAEAPKDQVRPEIFKLVDTTAIKDLMAKKNFAEVESRIKQAEAMPNLNPYEQYVLTRLRIALGSATQNEPMTMAALEAAIASGRLEKKEEAEFTNVLANSYYNAKNYPKAIETYKRYQQISETPQKVRSALVRAYYLSGNFAAARDELQPVIAEAEKSGKSPEPEDLKLLVSSAGKLKDWNAYVAGLEKLVAIAPNDDYWTDLLNRVQSKPGYNNRHQLDFYRLQNSAIKTMAPEEYTEMAELALVAGFPTEAKKALDQGFDAGVLGTGGNAAKHKALRDKANKGAADDAKNIASGEASAAKAKDGTGLVNLGYAYVTMGEFDKGIKFMEQGIAKGLDKKADEAKLHLGVAYAKAGRKADAIKVFEGLKGNDGLTDLAKYWTLLLNSQDKAVAAK